MSTPETTESPENTTVPTVEEQVMAVLGGFAAICGAPDDPAVADSANTALADLDRALATAVPE